MRICTETTDFYIDLVFYNYILTRITRKSHNTKNFAILHKISLLSA